MAHVDRIWLHDSANEKPIMRVYIKMKPAGEITLLVEIPQDFMDCLLKMAQAAADIEEQKMRAQILADTQGPKTGEE